MRRRFLAIGTLAIFAWYKRQGSVPLLMQLLYRNDTYVQSSVVSLSCTQLTAAGLMKTTMGAISSCWLRG